MPVATRTSADEGTSSLFVVVPVVCCINTISMVVLATTGIPENLDCRQAEERRCSRARRHAGAVGGAPSRWSRVPRHAPALPGQEVGVRQPGRQGWLPKGSRPTKG